MRTAAGGPHANKCRHRHSQLALLLLLPDLIVVVWEVFIRTHRTTATVVDASLYLCRLVVAASTMYG